MSRLWVTYIHLKVTIYNSVRNLKPRFLTFLELCITLEGTTYHDQKEKITSRPMDSLSKVWMQHHKTITKRTFNHIWNLLKLVKLAYDNLKSWDGYHSILSCLCWLTSKVFLVLFLTCEIPTDRSERSILRLRAFQMMDDR